MSNRAGIADPVLDLETGDPGEVFRISRHERQPVAEGDRGDAKIRFTPRYPPFLELGLYPAENRGA